MTRWTDPVTGRVRGDDSSLFPGHPSGCPELDRRERQCAVWLFVSTVIVVAMSVGAWCSDEGRAWWWWLILLGLYSVCIVSIMVTVVGVAREHRRRDESV